MRAWNILIGNTGGFKLWLTSSANTHWVCFGGFPWSNATILNWKKIEETNTWLLINLLLNQEISQILHNSGSFTFLNTFFLIFSTGCTPGEQNVLSPVYICAFQPNTSNCSKHSQTTNYCLGWPMSFNFFFISALAGNDQRAVTVGGEHESKLTTPLPTTLTSAILSRKYGTIIISLICQIGMGMGSIIIWAFYIIVSFNSIFYSE